MKKGVIMNIEREYLTMLTPEGEFIKTRNRNENYQLGDELVFFPLQEEQISRYSIKNRLSPFKLKWISALTAILLVISFIPTYFNDDVYAYMSIDINPSFEIGLDQDLQVVKLKAMNKEAELIVQQIDKWKNQHVDVITEAIITKSRENGFLNEGQEIIITTVIEEDIEDEEEAKIEEDLEADLSVLSNALEKEDIVITSIKSDEETREKAKKQGVSTGKLIQQEKKMQIEKGKKLNNGNNSNRNNDNASQKKIKNSEKQLKNDQKEQRKEQKVNEKKQQKGKSKEAEIKKEKGKEKAIREKDNQQRNNNRNDKAKDRQQDRKERQQERQENSGR
jgi:hypothetical protein